MKLKHSVALVSAILVSFTSLHAGQVTTGFFGRVRDPAQRWIPIPPNTERPPVAMLFGYAGFSAPTISRYEITVTCIDNEAVAPNGSLIGWPYDPINEADAIYHSVYGLYVNDQLIGEFGTTHRAERIDAAGVYFWKGPASTTTFSFTPTTTGTLDVEMRPIDPAGATTLNEYADIKRRRHSVGGLISLSLSGPGINSSDLDALESQVTAIENQILVITNDLEVTQSQFESFKTAANGQLGDLELRQIVFQQQITGLQQQIADQYNQLKGLIDANTAAIAQNTGNLQSLLEQQALLQSKVGGIQADLATLTQTVTQQFAELNTVIAEHDAKLAALQAAQNSTSQALTALETAVANNKSALETKVQELEAKLNQLGLDKDAQVAALQNQIDELKGNSVTVTELQTQLTQITVQKDTELAALQQELDRLNGSQTSQDDQIAQLQQELESTKSGALLTSQALQQQIDALNIQRGNQQAAIDGLNQTIETTKAEKNAELAALQQQIDAANQTNASQQVDINLLNARLTALKVETDNQVAALNVQLGNLTNEKEETEQRLETVHNQLTNENAAQAQEIATLQLNIDALMEDKAVQDNKISTLEQQLLVVKNEKATQVQQLEENIEAATRDHEAECAALEARIAALEARSTENETAHVEEKAQLQKDLAALRKNIKSSESSMSSQMWGIGLGAALIGVVSPGVYDHAKEEGMFDSSTGTSGAVADEMPFTPAGWYKTPVSTAGAAGWIK